MHHIACESREYRRQECWGCGRRRGRGGLQAGLYCEGPCNPHRHLVQGVLLSGSIPSRRHSWPALELPLHTLCELQIANAILAGSRLQVLPLDKLPAGDLMVYDAYVDLMHSCWEQDPAARPAFHTIVKSLQ